MEGPGMWYLTVGLYLSLFQQVHVVHGTVPPAALFVGMGYDILKGNPDGDSHMNVGKDPGLLMTRQILKLDPPDSPRELSYHEYSLCFPTHYREVFYGTKSYQSRLLHDLIDIGNTTANITSHAFSLSEGFQVISRGTSQEGFVYIDEISFCNKGRSRYMSSLARSHKFNIGDEFAASVCALPRSYDQQIYMNFLQDWGTHVIMEVEFGWETKTRKRLAVKDIIQSLIANHPELLVPTGVVNGHTSTVSVSKSFIENQSSLETLTAKMTTVSTSSRGSKQISEPIKYKVVSIDEMLNVDYWQTPADIVDEGHCASGFENLLPVWQQNIKKAMGHYAAYHNAPTATESTLEYPLSWPTPPFALPEPLTGCPGDKSLWKIGNVTHQVNASRVLFPNNTFHYQGMHLKGLQKSSVFKMSYCGRNLSSSPSEDPWPKGSYCIAQVSNQCPAGFSSGYISYSLYSRHYPQPVIHQVGISGGVPKYQISPGRNYMVYYCCRNDGSIDQPIILPYQEPFYLYPDQRTRKCQKVFGMRYSDEWVKYPYTQLYSRCYHFYPYDEDCDHFHTVHYCYYSRNTTVIYSGNVIG
ncbi:uncharacterized protein LOC125676191 [Ostrea edulis]|uniref:uncharacterized protein LOC125676191 n=1 Tax=Ostrea edulis TaxID=37623 RepID=UPI0024AF88C5|nr:uncharacterized protein LOC125676191 [Ostrea edulis]